MDTSSRIFKQLIVVFILIGSLGLIYLGNKIIFGDNVPVPTQDPRQLLSPIEVSNTRLFKIKDNDYDFLFVARNPNQDFGSPEVSYHIDFINSVGDVVGKKEGTFYILPNQIKNIVGTEIILVNEATSFSVKIISVDWQELSSIGAQGVNLSIIKSNFQKSNLSYLFGTASGSIFNNSDFDIGKANVVIVLRDKEDNPIGVNVTDIRTFISRTNRGFEVFWTEEFEGEVSRVEVNAYADVFQNETFIKSFGGKNERFQQMF